MLLWAVSNQGLGTESKYVECSHVRQPPGSAGRDDRWRATGVGGESSEDHSRGAILRPIVNSVWVEARVEHGPRHTALRAQDYGFFVISNVTSYIAYMLPTSDANDNWHQDHKTSLVPHTTFCSHDPRLRIDQQLGSLA